ncbi:hypothetical protein [Schaalia sp. lx-260]|uniref:hypothetical protein n=1 Tax=Schaalia sp. lx-260 TaxID=2899082 RepID=UPI001E2C1AB8|nr:hypothetical protein [Schaalia sp. lx-260]MCD4549523.1 hypothetical protein [Schaalia sp. lx-260]
MKNSLLRITLAASLVVTMGIGLAACSSSSSTQSGASASAASGEDSATKADLEKALQTVKDTLASKPELTQIYLANDVDKPTEKYGMLVVPYAYSDATEKLTTSIVEINGGKYVIGAVAKESQKTWQIDQDGKISEKTK